MISTHILDTTLGMPAKNVNVELAKHDGQHWVDIQVSATNEDGRIVFNCPAEKACTALNLKLKIT